MKFSCEKTLLQNAISTAKRAAASKSSIPALEGILIEAEDNIRLTGYNMETGIRTVVPADVLEEGALVVSSRLLDDIVSKLPDEIVNISSDALTAHIESGMSKFNIQAMDAKDFPDLPTVERQNALELPQTLLADMIARTFFAISDNDTRPVLTGSLFEVTQGVLAVVSVDGQRLAIRREGLKNAPDIDFSFVVPGTALKEVRSICTDADSPVEITAGARHILFRIGSTLLITRRLEGEFLDYRQVLSRRSTVRLTVNVELLKSSLERVSIVISEKFKSPVRCLIGDGYIDLTSHTANNDAADRCPVEGDGNQLKIGFNNRLLMDALRQVPTQTALLKLDAPSSPCIIVPTDSLEGEEPYLFMVLPVRLSAG